MEFLWCLSVLQVYLFLGTVEMEWFPNLEVLPIIRFKIISELILNAQFAFIVVIGQ